MSDLIPEKIWIEIITNIIKEDEEGYVAKKPRMSYPRMADLWESNWGRLYRNPLTADPDTHYGKKFRGRFRYTSIISINIAFVTLSFFRVPFLFFTDTLLPLCKTADIFHIKKPSRIPYEFKILVPLRMLGRGVLADDCAEMSEIGSSTVNSILTEFVIQFAEDISGNFVKRASPEELESISNLYGHLGFHGSIGAVCML